MMAPIYHYGQPTRRVHHRIVGEVRTLTGSPPRDIEPFARDHRAELLA